MASRRDRPRAPDPRRPAGTQASGALTEIGPAVGGSSPGGRRAWDEDALTRRFAELAGGGEGWLVLGIGDDCAVLRPPGAGDLLWTLDSLEEGVDFHRGWLSAEEVGERAVAVALSDLAAMGGRPLAVLLALGSADPAPGGELLEVFAGAARGARRWGARVAGGDLTRRESGIGVTVTALGTVPHGKAVARGGARQGDELWVTGALGLGAAAVRLLERGGRQLAERRNPAALERFVRPSPRLAEGAWLRAHVPVRAAIDLSDGLARDLARLCMASRVGARLDAGAVARAAAGRGPGALRDALHGGEDFELLIAAPPGALARRAREFARRFGLPLTRVGEVMEGAGLVLRTPRGDGPLRPAGWDHVRPRRAAARAGASSARQATASARRSKPRRGRTR